MVHRVHDALRPLFIFMLVANLTMIIVHMLLSARPAADPGFHFAMAWIAAGSAVLMIVALCLVRK